MPYVMVRRITLDHHLFFKILKFVRVFKANKIGILVIMAWAFGVCLVRHGPGYILFLSPL